MRCYVESKGLWEIMDWFYSRKGKKITITYAVVVFQNHSDAASYPILSLKHFNLSSLL